MSDLLTPAARAILEHLEWMRAEMLREADDETNNPYAIARFAAKAETYGSLIAWFPRKLRDVEREAVDIEASENARLDALLEEVA